MNYSFDKVVNRRNPLEGPLKYNGKYEMNFKELLMKAKQGDKGAREELFLMYRPMVLSRSRIKGIFSEDLYQELSKTFVSCIEQFSIEGTENEQK